MNRYEYIDTVQRARELGLAGPRDRTAHVHILDGKPLIGASTGSNVSFGADNLMQWYSDMAAVAGLAKPQQDMREAYEKANVISDKVERSKAKKELDKLFPDYADARRAATQSRDSSAKKGTLRHGILEDYVRRCIQTNEGKPLESNGVLDEGIHMFIDWALKEVEKFYFTEANCYSECIWVGGICDLALLLKDGRRALCDHKSSREAYVKQFVQIATYDILLSENGALDNKGNKISDWKSADVFIVFPFRSEPFTPEYRTDVQVLRAGAESAISLYKLFEGMSIAGIADKK